MGNLICRLAALCWVHIFGRIAETGVQTSFSPTVELHEIVVVQNEEINSTPVVGHDTVIIVENESEETNEHFYYVPKRPLFPAFPYQGSKRLQQHKIVEHRPSNYYGLRVSEPFSGCAANFWQSRHTNYILNDKDFNVYSLLYCIKEDLITRAIQVAKVYENNKPEFIGVRDTPENDHIMAAAKAIYLLYHSYNSNMMSYCPDSSKESNRIQPFENRMQNREYYNHIQNAELYNLDYTEIMDMANTDEDFIMMDPPYVDTAKYPTSFSKQNHIECANKFKESRAKCLVMVEDHPLMRELYKGYIVERYVFKYGSNKKDPVYHLIIKNY